MTRTSDLSRRDFLHAGLVGGAGAILATSSLGGIGRAAEGAKGVCITLFNHWSYTGIGWQLGLESCVLSATDAMEMADRPPHVKTCLNLDARAFERMVKEFPEAANKLKKYLAEGKVELVGGSYGQPMGTMFSGETNIRQMVMGQKAIRKTMDYEMATFLEQEEFTHPQMPQIIVGAGFRYASLAQLDTWGRAGVPPLDYNVIGWKGIDGTTINTIPKTPFLGIAGLMQLPDPKQLAAEPTFQKLEALGKPLIFTLEEFGWESPEQPFYLTASERYIKFAEQMPAEYVTCKQYLDQYGSVPDKIIYLPMDAWNKSLTWGLGGDQLRILDRKVQAILFAAERFDAIASILGEPTQVAVLDEAWKDLLASQSHDVGLCEYSRWQGFDIFGGHRMAPLDRIEDFHNFTWGAIGYNLLDAAKEQGRKVLDASLDHVAARINSATDKRGATAVTVFNPSGFQRSDMTLTGRIYPIPEKAVGVTVKDRAGRVVPSQIVKDARDSEGNLAMASLAFVADKVPGVGYETYYLEFTPQAPAATPTALQIDESALALENEHVKVRLDPVTGGVASLIDKRTGRETLDGAKGAFPVFTGRPNPNLPLRPNAPASYDSTKSKASLDWVEKGPMRATLRAIHKWNYLTLETRVTLAAGSPYVEVVSRVLAGVPPHPDAVPREIVEGYWFSYAPAFKPASVIRDFPLAIEPTQHGAFHALTFVDLTSEDRGLLLLHAGTQWFRRDEQGMFSNLVMREWGSFFDKDHGWPPYAEYRHALMPHDGNLTNADRLRASSAFSEPLIARVGPVHEGDLPATKGFIAVEPAAVRLTALRRKTDQQLEIRVAEAEGQEVPAHVEFGFPIADACETNLLGDKVADVDREKNRLDFPIHPWKIRTFEIHS